MRKLTAGVMHNRVARSLGGSMMGACAGRMWRICREIEPTHLGSEWKALDNDAIAWL
jgi:hypothetical protein